MAENIAGFDWDEGNRGKCQKHGVALADIEAMFRSRISIFPDGDHSRAEERLKAIGSVGGRHILIVFTIRHHGGETLIRPISARYMHQKEVRLYEEEAARAAERSRS